MSDLFCIVSANSDLISILKEQILSVSPKNKIFIAQNLNELFEKQSPKKRPVIFFDRDSLNFTPKRIHTALVSYFGKIKIYTVADCQMDFRYHIFCEKTGFTGVIDAGQDNKDLEKDIFNACKGENIFNSRAVYEKSVNSTIYTNIPAEDINPKEAALLDLFYYKNYSRKELSFRPFSIKYCTVCHDIITSVKSRMGVSNLNDRELIKKILHFDTFNITLEDDINMIKTGKFPDFIQ